MNSMTLLRERRLEGREEKEKIVNNENKMEGDCGQSRLNRAVTMLCTTAGVIGKGNQVLPRESKYCPEGKQPN